MELVFAIIASIHLMVLLLTNHDGRSTIERAATVGPSILIMVVLRIQEVSALTDRKQ